MGDEERAKAFERLAGECLYMAKLIRGEEVDSTGRGFDAILQSQIERATGKKMMTERQYQEYKRLRGD